MTKESSSSDRHVSLKAELHPKLCRKRHAYRRPRAEEISQRTAGHLQVFHVGNGPLYRAGRVHADVSYVAGFDFAGRHWQRGYVSDVIVAGVLAVEQVEEFEGRTQAHPVIQFEVAADAQIDLGEGDTAEFIVRVLLFVDHGTHFCRYTCGCVADTG